MVGERIRRAFEAAGVTVAGCDLHATVSIGAACGQPGTDIVALLAAADAALYRAKANGRNRVELAQEPEMPVLFATTPAPAERAERRPERRPLATLAANPAPR